MRTWKDVATLVKTKNLKGRFVARGAAGLPFLLEEGMKVALVPPQTDLPREGVVDFVRNLDGSSFELGLDSVRDEETARGLVGCHILATRADLVGFSPLNGISVPISGASAMHGSPALDSLNGIPAPISGASAMHDSPALDSLNGISAPISGASAMCRGELPLALRFDSSCWNGWQVVEGEAVLGEVIGLVENPAHPLLEIDLAGTDGSALIPLVDEFIVGIDEARRIIEVDLPAGLLDL